MAIQSKKRSIIETTTNTILGIIMGFTISQLAHHYEAWIQINIWKEFTWQLSAESNLIMTMVITASSFIRGYIVRRCFNKLEKEKS